MKNQSVNVEHLRHFLCKRSSFVGVGVDVDDAVVVVVDVDDSIVVVVVEGTQKKQGKIWTAPAYK